LKPAPTTLEEMNPERWRRVNELFTAAVDLEPQHRAAFLDRACPDDHSLRSEVESLLASDERGWSSIEKPAVEVAAPLLATEQPQLTSGQTFSHYEIERMIGKGGMGEVYLAADKLLNRKIALKLLPADYTRDQQRLQRFQQEAQAASALNHPNILTIHELREVDGRQFIATEFVDGETLRQRLKRAPLTLAETLEIAIQIASALSAAHQAGIVHRDLKPENVMLRADGYVKVLDFGLAKLTEQYEPAPAVRHTVNPDLSSGLLLGTVKYMSPEQARGLSVDARSDIFSFGAVLYEMISGRAPFSQETNKDLIAAIMTEKPAPLAGVPSELQSVISQALNKEKEERYQTADELLIDLRKLKETLDLETRLYRTDLPINQTALAADSAQPTARVSSPETISTATSIEYLISEIKQHKSIAAVASVLLISILGMGYFVYRSSGRRTGRPESMTATRLTIGGVVGNAAISRDEQYIAYSSGAGGLQSLWIRQLKTNSSRQIVPPSKAEYGTITFSPDGNSLFYFGNCNENEEGLCQVSVLGGTPRKVIDGISGSPVTFAPDEARLAFVRGNDAGETALVIANIDGSNQRTLAVRQPPSSFASASWSPDGQRIVCTELSKENNVLHWHLFAIETENGVEREGRESIIATKTFRAISQIAWLSDGSGWLIIAAEEDSGDQIWEIAYPTGEARRISNDVGGYSGLSLSADSNVLVTTHHQVVANIWNQPAAEAAQARQITSGSSTRDGWSGLAWTPDGRIVYSSHASGQPDIWIMNADGSNPQQLTTDMGSVYNGLAVSPDGRYIVFVSRRGGSTNLWRIDIEGQNPKQLTNGPGEFNPIFSPDGQWVRYMAAGSGKQTPMKVNIDGGEPVPSGDAFPWVLGMSPDGKLKAFVLSNDQGDTTKRIAIAPYAGGEPISVINLPPLAQLSNGMRWTPDGKALTYIMNPNDVSNIWKQPIDGGRAQQLTDFKADRIMRFAWSADGKQLAFVRTPSTNELVMMKNFR
jgi:serine/threonine protein kinase/dipeptidyl aminopeptidase/acylaminoacyl peptidase